MSHFATAEAFDLPSTRCVAWWGLGVMVASRVRVLRASNSARFWLSAFCIALMPTWNRISGSRCAHRASPEHVRELGRRASDRDDRSARSASGDVQFDAPDRNPSFPRRSNSRASISIRVRSTPIVESRRGAHRTFHAPGRVPRPSIARIKATGCRRHAGRGIDPKTLPQLQPIDQPEQTTTSIYPCCRCLEKLHR